MIAAYKAFDRDLSCTSANNRFQYQPGVWNEEPEANCGKNGFHCAENPLDCLSYYPAWEMAVYYLVLADGDINEDANDSKISCTRLKLVKRLEMGEFIAHSLQYIYEHPLRENNRYVHRDEGTAYEGFIVVRGKNPIAKGKLGDILGLVKEERESRAVMEAGIYIIDGTEMMPDIWYNTDGSVCERQVM